ncbi:MAG TPA: hypothetical protein DCQ51_18210 [Planktothrix sp. UBA8407]|jgi:PEP-CTERM putative exosortase interaction domain|nr:hypothetical protein [Planktothrix sp. UBA8407]HBK23082.1 hypothetical protein [Planktothrix sp. UBA10369]
MKFNTLLSSALIATSITVAAGNLPAQAMPPTPEQTPTKEVPEPLTILGSVAALGFGSMFKKQADKNKNQAS